MALSFFRRQGSVLFIGDAYLVKRSSIPQGEGVGKIQEFGLDGRKLHGCTERGLVSKKKTGTRRAAVFLKSVLGQGLLDALFGKARACRSALAGLELGIALADHIQRALALHDLAVCVAALHRG